MNKEQHDQAAVYSPILVSAHKSKKNFYAINLIFYLFVTIAVYATYIVFSDPCGGGLSPNIASAKSDIQSLENALRLYEMDTGDYPSNDVGLTGLIDDPSIEKWNGPYLTKNISSDPWGHNYVYRYPGSQEKMYDLFSVGKDGIEGTKDDISIWNINNL